MNDPIPTEKISVRVDKVWVDEEDVQNRPTITIRLMDGENIVRQIQLPNGETSYTFEGLEKYREDRVTEINYTVIEDTVPGYKTPEVTGNMESGFIITNTK